MTEYVATPKLRWADAAGSPRKDAPRFTGRSGDLFMLQQWWETQMYASDGTHRITLPQTVGEWRDVPLETEK